MLCPQDSEAQDTIPALNASHLPMFPICFPTFYRSVLFETTIVFGRDFLTGNIEEAAAWVKNIQLVSKHLLSVHCVGGVRLHAVDTMPT